MYDCTRYHLIINLLWQNGFISFFYVLRCEVPTAVSRFFETCAYRGFCSYPVKYRCHKAILHLCCPSQAFSTPSQTPPGCLRLRVSQPPRDLVMCQKLPGIQFWQVIGIRDLDIAMPSKRSSCHMQGVTEKFIADKNPNKINLGVVSVLVSILLSIPS